MAHYGRDYGRGYGREYDRGSRSRVTWRVAPGDREDRVRYVGRGYDRGLGRGYDRGYREMGEMHPRQSLRGGYDRSYGGYDRGQRGYDRESRGRFGTGYNGMSAGRYNPWMMEGGAGFSGHWGPYGQSRWRDTNIGAGFTGWPYGGYGIGARSYSPPIW